MAILWLTGQPKAGKTTLALNVEYRLGSKCIAVIDGDDLRKGCNNKDYSIEGRHANIKMAQEMAIAFDEPHRYVIVSVVAPYRDIREEFKRKNRVKEVYLFSDRIDPNKVSEYEPPLTNALYLDTSRYNIDTCTQRILNFCGFSSEEPLYCI